jgi:hypothetical protein
VPIGRDRKDEYKQCRGAFVEEIRPKTLYLGRRCGFAFRTNSPLGEYSPDLSHLADGRIPGSEIARRFIIGEREFDIPLLTREHIQRIIAIGLPTAEMKVMQNLDARLQVIHAILSPFYLDVTIAFLEENLTLPDSDALIKGTLPVASTSDAA